MAILKCDSETEAVELLDERLQLWDQRVRQQPRGTPLSASRPRTDILVTDSTAVTDLHLCVFALPRSDAGRPKCCPVSLFSESSRLDKSRRQES